MSPRTATVRMVDFQPDAIACFIQALLYGVYVVSFSHCLRWLLLDSEGRKFRPNLHWPMIIVTVTLFVLMTSNLAAMILLALEKHRGSSAYLTTFVASAGIGVSALLIVDGVLIYRCWTIYSNSWLTVILPLAFLWTADLVSAIIGVVFLALNNGWPSARPQQPNSGRYDYGLSIAYMTYFICDIAINVYATSAIFLQIIRVKKWHSRRDSGRLYKIGLILVESGILFTITSVLTLCLKLIGMGKLQFASFIMGIINFSTAGLTFNLILIGVLKQKPQPIEGSQDENKTTILLSTVQFGASISAQTTESELP